MSGSSPATSATPEVADVPFVTPKDANHDAPMDRIARAKLGMATSLFTALRVKHAPTAEHSLRVALGCSSWCQAMGLPESTANEVEVSALLHDVGKIGVPESILLKPSGLINEEVQVMHRHHVYGLEILSACNANDTIKANIYYASAWYNGRRPGFDRKQGALPLGARMIAIMDAYDSMTTYQVYRRALSQERTLTELYKGGGIQFDPKLIKEFCKLVSKGQIRLDTEMAGRWLKTMQPSGELVWADPASFTKQTAAVPQRLDPYHYLQLLDMMQDGVIFVDANMRIIEWNRGATRLTGIEGSSVLHKYWDPRLLHMQTADEEPVTGQNCPVRRALESKSRYLNHMIIADRSGKQRPVNFTVSTVLNDDGTVQGASLLMHDRSKQITLEERVQSLLEKATIDPLTGVANRAEFERTFDRFIDTHLELRLPCSIIMCDIDYFKQMNDKYGHPQADEALATFANTLQAHVRAGDLVARYGGEEFVVLCADCDNLAATKRAELLRKTIAQMPIKALANSCITASFGVTELQDGDSADTLLRRVDRALLQAKSNGRNRVVQLGSGVEEAAPRRSGAIAKLAQAFDRSKSRTAEDGSLQSRLISNVPRGLAVEKLRGFVADHGANIVDIDPDSVTLKLGTGGLLFGFSRETPPFLIDLYFSEVRPDKSEDGSTIRTMIDVTVRPLRSRDQKRPDLPRHATTVINSLKSYFMASELRIGDRDAHIRQEHLDGELDEEEQVDA